MRFGRYATLALLLFAASSPLHAQGLKDRLKSKVKDRVEQKSDQAMDKGLDKAEAAISCKVSDKACIEKAQAAGKDVEVTDADGNPLPESAQASAKASGMKPGQGAWANFDFVPGEQVLFAEDFSKDRVGNFPRRLELIGGTSEIVESSGQRWLRSGSSTLFTVNLKEPLPQRFTMEFDMVLPDYANGAVYVFTAVMPDIDIAEYTESSCAYCYAKDGYLAFGFNTGLYANSASGDARRLGGIEGAIEDDMAHRVRVHADGKYFKVYVDERRVVNVPNATMPRTDKLYFWLHVHPEYPPLIGNLSINAGGRDMYDALMADGRVATQGIYFDTGSDRIRPESSGTLKEIADMLNEHADLRLLVEGHTDNVGNAASNQTLSEKRAAAIKAALTSSYSIDAARLETKGLGATRPAASNDTPEGRQSNRRVELVKL